MARITVEDCLQKEKNRFFLIHMASKRVRQLRKGVEPSIVTKNRDIVTALREIAAGNIVKAEKINKNNLLKDKEEILSEELKEETEEKALKDEKSEEIIPEGN